MNRRVFFLTSLVFVVFVVICLLSLEKFGIGYESDFIKRKHVRISDSVEHVSFCYLGLFESPGLYGYSRIEITKDARGRVRCVSYWLDDSLYTNKQGIARTTLDYRDNLDGLAIVIDNYDISGNHVTGSGNTCFAHARLLVDADQQLLSAEYFDANGVSVDCPHYRIPDHRNSRVDMDLHW